ncbi:hypothetical protein TYRP_023561 [Tyrophagus putrescentiae]|nr:hypothetical protein TYRP_023561 [Tyrophagus putrescentiae]
MPLTSSLADRHSVQQQFLALAVRRSSQQQIIIVVGFVYQQKQYQHLPQQPKQSEAEANRLSAEQTQLCLNPICAGAAQARHINSSTLLLRRVFTRRVVGTTSKQGSGRSSRRHLLSTSQGSGRSNNNMSTSKEDVTAAQATKRRENLCRWITISHQTLSAGVNPGKSHQPAITRQAVYLIGGELILHDVDNPDERVEEYVNKLREIKQLLDEQEEKQKQQELFDLQLQKEAALIEQAKAKTAVTNTPKQALSNPMRLDLKIPPLNGSPAKYRRFEELFEALVEQSPSYTDAAKFLYFCELIGKLADQYAPNSSPTFLNLQVLKGRLRERYEDASRVREHFRATFEKLLVMRQSSPRPTFFTS